MTSTSFKVLVVLCVITGTQLSPSRHEKPVHQVLDVRTASTWLRTKTASNVWERSCSLFQERLNHLDWMKSMHNISTLRTSMDSAPACTELKLLFGARSHRKLKMAALRGNYKSRGVKTELSGLTLMTMKESLGSVACSLPYLKMDSRGTVAVLPEWTLGNMWSCWAKQLKPSQAPTGFL